MPNTEDSKQNTETHTWEEVAGLLARDVLFALNHLKHQGGGLILDMKSGKNEHWRKRFCKHLAKAGIEVDLDDAFAMELPKAKRRKYFSDKAKAKEAPLAPKKD